MLTANIFALMGLRQLYFLIGGLLKRLVYLSIGLAVLLGFIGVKLVLHALHENNLPFINGGEPFDVPDIPIVVSLGMIVLILGVTTVASLLKTRSDNKKDAAAGITRDSTAAIETGPDRPPVGRRRRRSTDEASATLPAGSVRQTADEGHRVEDAHQRSTDVCRRGRRAVVGGRRAAADLELDVTDGDPSGRYPAARHGDVRRSPGRSAPR